MNEVVEHAEKLIDMIKSKQREIDNPVLFISTLTAIEVFVEYVEAEKDE